MYYYLGMLILLAIRYKFGKPELQSLILFEIVKRLMIEAAELIFLKLEIEIRDRNRSEDGNCFLTMMFSI